VPVALRVGRGSAPARAAPARAAAAAFLQLLDLLARFLVASPSSTCADGGSGEVARPRSASPPPARFACAIACALPALSSSAH
jgi:hypothetical protein